MEPRKPKTFFKVRMGALNPPTIVTNGKLVMKSLGGGVRYEIKEWPDDPDD